MKNDLRSVYKPNLAPQAIARNYTANMKHQLYAAKGFYKEAKALGLSHDDAFKLKQSINQQFRVNQKALAREHVINEFAKNTHLGSTYERTLLEYVAPDLYNVMYGHDTTKTVNKQKLERQLNNLLHNSFSKNSLLKAFNEIIKDKGMNPKFVEWIEEERSKLIRGVEGSHDVLNQIPIIDDDYDSDDSPLLALLKEFKEKDMNGDSTEEEYQAHKATIEAYGIPWAYYRENSLKMANLSEQERKSATAEIAKSFLRSITK